MLLKFDMLWEIHLYEFLISELEIHLQSFAKLKIVIIQALNRNILRIYHKKISSATATVNDCASFNILTLRSFMKNQFYLHIHSLPTERLDLKSCNSFMIKI